MWGPNSQRKGPTLKLTALLTLMTLSQLSTAMPRDEVINRTLNCGNTQLTFGRNVNSALMGRKGGPKTKVDVEWDNRGIAAVIGDKDLQADGGTFSLDDADCTMER